MYHANLTQTTKNYVCDNFKCGKIRIIAATIAFGMVCVFLFQLMITCVIYISIKGMDIPDVEVVVVNGIPDSMLQLYQVCFFVCV